MISEIETNRERGIAVKCHSVIQLFNNSYTAIWILLSEFFIGNIRHGEYKTMITIDWTWYGEKCLLHIIFNGVYSSYDSSCTISNFCPVNKSRTKLFTSLAGKSFKNWFDIKAYPWEYVPSGSGGLQSKLLQPFWTS